MNIKQLNIVAHTLGVSITDVVENIRRSVLPVQPEFYRNVFCASDSHEDMPVLKELEDLGIMAQGASSTLWGSSTLWYVTEAGKGVFWSSLNVIATITPKQDIKVGDKVVVNIGNNSTYTVSHLIGNIVWFEECNDNCFIHQCKKI